MAGIALIAIAAALAAQQPDFELLYRQALQQREQALGESALKTRESARDLALYLTKRGEYTRAEPYVSAALELADSLADATALHNWAVKLEESNVLLAEKMYRKTLAIRAKALTPLDPDLATTRLNLSLLLIARGEAEAAQLASAALRSFENRSGAMDARVGAACGVLGTAAAIKGNVAAAEKLFRRALVISVKAWGSDAPETANALENLADLLQQTGRASAARPLLDRAQGIRSRSR
ncbi:MAG: tetratricopeptide repeat protein [Bryobacteraceae bacterium]|nr:tetratricopeptide repeat protein [Bryobacteraceae bacterium]